MTEISTANGNLTDLSPEEEKQVITDLSIEGEAVAKEGDTFYVLSLRWWRSWLAFVNQSPTISTNNGSSQVLSRPPSIDNSDLIRESESSILEIYDGLVEATHYILIPQNMWTQLHTWYGGGPTLARKVITRGSSQTELTVEVYPLLLQLHFIPRLAQYSILISRKETIGALHHKACEIFNLTPYQVRIWDYYGLQKHAIFNDLNQTLDAANIQPNQDILVEVVAHNGRHSPIVQNNGYAKIDPLPVLEPSKMNLSQFQNLSVAKKPTPTSAGLIGLVNLGNTCFMNSAIQCLVHTPQIVTYFLGDFQHEINSQNPLGMEGELALAFGELVRKLWAWGQGGRAAFPPRAFRVKLARFAPQFGGFNQHDIQELLAFLLDGLHEDLNRVRQKPYSESRDADNRPDEQVANEYWANHISRNDSIIVDVFQGQYKSTLICPTCDKISVTFDPFMYLSLPLQSANPDVTPHTLSMYTCMESFLRKEKLLEPEDMWFCPQCKEKRQASKKLDLWKLPEVLVIHLKRFWYSRTMKSKLDTFIDFPLHDFDLTKYLPQKIKNKNNPNSSQVYELYAIANHYGNMGSGHYTAIVKLINENKWYNFDDSRVYAISEDDVKSNAAYLLFYRRVKNTVSNGNGTHFTLGPNYAVGE